MPEKRKDDSRSSGRNSEAEDADPGSVGNGESSPDSVPPPVSCLHVHLLWEPWRSQPAALDTMVRDIRELGFNCLNIEAKPWEEFFDYYADPSSAGHWYPGNVERLLAACRSHGLSHGWMGFWILGENLDRLGVSDLRVRQGETCWIPRHLAEEDRFADRHYKSWSPEVVRTLADHHEGLCRSFDENFGEGKKPTWITGCEFTVRPSFDREGKERYVSWLRDRYGSIGKFNAAYGAAFADFEDLEPEDYWENFEGRPRDGLPWRQWYAAEEEFLAGGARMRRWADNQLWRADESENFACELRREFERRDLPVRFWLWSNQWKQFLQDRDQPIWFHCAKANDPWRMRTHLDEVSFITSPSDCAHRSSPAALSLELAIARSINRFEPFHAALFLGRHMLGDVYDRVTPGEAIATSLSAGATRGILAYGYNGLDDGGCLVQMPRDFRDSVSAGLEWFHRVAPQLDTRWKRSAGILFPLATMQLEPPRSSAEAANGGGSRATVDFEGHRSDVLGWYAALTDARYGVDFFHSLQVEQGDLASVEVLVLPWSPAYRWMPAPRTESVIEQWVRAGGVLLCGPDESALPGELRDPSVPHPAEAIEASEAVVADGPEIRAFEGVEPIARFRSGATAIGMRGHGKGRVVRFGFHFGRSYALDGLESVVTGTHESFFPAGLLRGSLIGEILGKVGVEPLRPEVSTADTRGIEFVRNGRGWLVVNHSRHPMSWPDAWLHADTLLGANPQQAGLFPHDAAWIPDPEP